MSRTPAYSYEIIQPMDLRKPQIARVSFGDGSTKDFHFGHYTTGRRISEMLPKMVMDFAKGRVRN
jgi:hypothetical protein